jgi:hypothetical protein
MSTNQDALQVYRGVLVSMLNTHPCRNWDDLIQFAPNWHVDLEDEEMFAIHINERIMFAAKALKKKGASWPKDFETMSKLIAAEIPELA